jgi:hypothetical protein
VLAVVLCGVTICSCSFLQGCTLFNARLCRSSLAGKLLRLRFGSCAIWMNDLGGMTAVSPSIGTGWRQSRWAEMRDALREPKRGLKNNALPFVQTVESNYLSN